MTKEEKVQRVVEEFLSKKYGETIEHFRLATLIEERENTREYWSIMAKAQNKLLDCGKMVENIRGVGYRVVEPDDYTKQTAKCVRSAGRRINKGVKIMLNAPVKDMSAIGVQEYNVICDRTRILQAALTGAKAEINMLASQRKNPLLVMVDQSKRVG